MKIWLCVVSVLCWANVACAQLPQESPNVPLSDPAYTDVNLLISRGVQINCFDATYQGPRHMTRFEFAIAISRLCRFSNVSGYYTRNSKAGYEAPIQEALSKFENPREKDALARLVMQFIPELQQLGIAHEQIEFAQKELATNRESTSAPITSTPFPDVPKTHWAYNAVETLRQSGIVIGYPDNTFTKQRPTVLNGN